MLREIHRDKYLSPDQTQALVRALDADEDQTTAAAIALLIVTGARRSEVMLTRWENVDFGRNMLTVPRSKTGRPRYIPLSPYAVAILHRQLAKSQAAEAARVAGDQDNEGRAAANPHVFPSHRRPGKPLEGLRGAWKRAKAVAGLPPDLRIHDLRHSFASALANAGTPLNEIGTVLGHTQLSTTNRYAHHSPQRLIATATSATTAWNLLPKPPAHDAA
jgi:integrase